MLLTRQVAGLVRMVNSFKSQFSVLGVSILKTLLTHD